MASVHPFFEITKHGSIGSPRCGVLRGCPTPCLVGTTRGGAVPYVTADLMQLENMDIGSLPACVALEEVLLEYKHYAKQKQSLREYFNLTLPKLVMLSIRQPGSLANTPTNADQISIDTLHGRQKVDVETYLNIIRATKADINVALCDEVPFHASKNRHSKSVKRTLSWLSAIVEKGEAAEANEGIFGVVLGGNHMKLRKICAEGVASFKGIQGVVIGGLGVGETDSERRDVLENVLPLIPPEMCRLMKMAISPLGILQAISKGIDVVQSDYAESITRLGYASVYLIPEVPGSEPNGNTVNGEGVLSECSRDRKRRKTELENPYPEHCPDNAVTKISLRDKRFERDTAPIMPGCNCFSCRSYCRAYINHLLNAHEMLASTLVYIHNLSRLKLLVDRARESVRRGCFPEFFRLFKAHFTG